MPGAYYWLGVAYDKGEGVARDWAKAAEWMGRLEQVARQGDAWAQFRLGVAYGRGEGVARDHAKGIEWLRKAARQGHAMAQQRLLLI